MADPFLPDTAPDGTQIADKFGNIFIYDDKVDSWVDTGVRIQINVVTEKSDGYITPEIYKQITSIQGLVAKGYNYQYNKIYVGPITPSETTAETTLGGVPYFYYIHSTDNTIKFKTYKIDDETIINIEVNKSGIINKLLRNRCVGGRGLKGATGLQGLPGTPARNEIYGSFLDLEETSATLKTKVNTPIDTPISLRIYSQDTLLAEIQYPIG